MPQALPTANPGHPKKLLLSGALPPQGWLRVLRHTATSWGGIPCGTIHDVDVSGARVGPFQEYICWHHAWICFIIAPKDLLG